MINPKDRLWLHRKTAECHLRNDVPELKYSEHVNGGGGGGERASALEWEGAYVRQDGRVGVKAAGGGREGGRERTSGWAQ